MGTFAIRKRRSTPAIAAFAAMGSAAVSAYETQMSYTAYTAAGSCRGRCEVEQTGPACHTNRRSCFYTAVREGAEVEILAPQEV